MDDPAPNDPQVPVSPNGHKKKVRTWGPSSVHQKERESRSKRVIVRDSFSTSFSNERCASVPNLGTIINNKGKKQWIQKTFRKLVKYMYGKLYRMFRECWSSCVYEVVSSWSEISIILTKGSQLACVGWG